MQLGNVQRRVASDQARYTRRPLDSVPEKGQVVLSAGSAGLGGMKNARVLRGGKSGLMKRQGRLMSDSGSDGGPRAMLGPPVSEPGTLQWSVIPLKGLLANAPPPDANHIKTGARAVAADALSVKVPPGAAPPGFGKDVSPTSVLPPLPAGPKQQPGGKGPAANQAGGRAQSLPPPQPPQAASAQQGPPQQGQPQPQQGPQSPLKKVSKWGLLPSSRGGDMSESWDDSGSATPVPPRSRRSWAELKHVRRSRTQSDTDSATAASVRASM